MAFPALSAIEEGFDVFVVLTRQGPLMKLPGIRHGIACRSWCAIDDMVRRGVRAASRLGNDIEGLATLFSNHIPDYRN